MSNNFPCKCGHSFVQHAIDGEWIGKKFCLKCFSWLNGQKVPTCDEYTPDNLRYLEQKALDK
jgi:hypothetical protein